MRSTELVRSLHRYGLTYRKLDYWLRKGLVPGMETGVGTGNDRILNDDAVFLIDRVARLTAAGLSLDAAIQIAKDMKTSGQGTIIRGDVIITMSDVITKTEGK